MENKQKRRTLVYVFLLGYALVMFLSGVATGCWVAQKQDEQIAKVEVKLDELTGKMLIKACAPGYCDMFNR